MSTGRIRRRNSASVPAISSARAPLVDAWLAPPDNPPQRVADKRRHRMRLSVLFDEFERHSRRIEPITRSAYAFCHSERGTITTVGCPTSSRANARCVRRQLLSVPRTIPNHRPHGRPKRRLGANSARATPIERAQGERASKPVRCARLRSVIVALDEPSDGIRQTRQYHRLTQHRREAEPHKIVVVWRVGITGHDDHGCC